MQNNRKIINKPSRNYYNRAEKNVEKKVNQLERNPISRQARINYRKKKERRKQVRQNRLLLASIGVFLLVLILFISQRLTIAKLNKNAEDQKIKQEELTQKISNLEDEIKKVNSLEYIEEKARKDLGMVKADDKIYVKDLPSKDDNDVNKDVRSDQNTLDQPTTSDNQNQVSD